MRTTAEAGLWIVWIQRWGEGSTAARPFSPHLGTDLWKITRMCFHSSVHRCGGCAGLWDDEGTGQRAPLSGQGLPVFLTPVLRGLWIPPETLGPQGVDNRGGEGVESGDGRLGGGKAVLPPFLPTWGQACG